MPDLAFDRICVIGAGTMGHGIAHVCAAAGAEVTLFDLRDDTVQAGLDRIAINLDKGIARGKVSEDEREATLTRLTGATDLGLAVSEADLVIEAIPEDLGLKQAIFREAAEVAPGAVFATNTSSLSVAAIASALPDPSHVLGMHFFNPVHIMRLLEVIHHEDTDPAVLERVVALGEAIGKQVIVVRDSPGFATSRLGLALGMEAIRMLEEGVASAADIDAAMVLGYRHPVGPLKLTDMVGLDVRMAIGEYLARELDNPAFEPPALLRELVSDGFLGQKSGKGFYDW